MSAERYFCSIIEKNRMLAYFSIPRLLNDMKIGVQKNHFGAEILYRSPDLVKKRRLTRSRDEFREKFLDPDS